MLDTHAPTKIVTSCPACFHSLKDTENHPLRTWTIPRCCFALVVLVQGRVGAMEVFFPFDFQGGAHGSTRHLLGFLNGRGEMAERVLRAQRVKFVGSVVCHLTEALFG